jgi:hypothetical protein
MMVDKFKCDEFIRNAINEHSRKCEGEIQLTIAVIGEHKVPASKVCIQYLTNYNLFLDQQPQLKTIREVQGSIALLPKHRGFQLSCGADTSSLGQNGEEAGTGRYSNALGNRQRN